MFLSDDVPLGVRRTGLLFSRDAAPEWTTQRRGTIPRLGLRLTAGFEVRLPEVHVARGDVLLVTLGSEQAAPPSAYRLTWRRPSRLSSDREIARGLVREASAMEPWQEIVLDLDAIAGQRGSIVVRCEVDRNDRDAHARSLLLFELVVAPRDAVDLERSRSFRALRIRNEQANFDAYYQHEVFQRPAAAAGPPKAPDAPSAETRPRPESALEYSRRRLAERIGLDPPRFRYRLHQLANGTGHGGRSAHRDPLRVLSLCSGAARIEAALLAGLSRDAVSITLVDVNDKLLELARRSCEPHAAVDVRVADVNGIALPERHFDVILCVSGLHHVVELEHVFAQVASALKPDGEFWSIGETLGRNGGRLYPEALAAGNAFFSRLPERLRYNRTMQRVDATLPDLDHSIGCFEGIRCEAIEPTLNRFLVPRHVARHNCVVWKLFSLDYSDNYDLASEADRRLVDEAVEIDATLQAEHGIGVELNAIYGVR